MIRGRIFGTPILEPGDYGLPRPRSVTAIRNPIDTTSHYAGPTDWRHAGIDRSTADRFRLTTDHARCALIVLAHADFHMRPVSQGGRGWVHYAYSGSSCPHGVGFIGRGRDVRTAANGTTAGNDSSYAIQYTGAGEADPLTVEAMRSFIDMADYLREPLRREHADHKPTACSGPHIRPWRRAGFPRPPGGTTPPPPVPLEDDDMTILAFSAPGKPQRLFVDGIVHGWSDDDDRKAVLAALSKAGYKVATAQLTVPGYESLTRSAITGSDFQAVEDKLSAIALYEAAQLEVESREEQRDLATPSG